MHQRIIDVVYAQCGGADTAQTHAQGAPHHSHPDVLVVLRAGDEDCDTAPVRLQLGFDCS